MKNSIVGIAALVVIAVAIHYSGFLDMLSPLNIALLLVTAPFILSPFVVFLFIRMTNSLAIEKVAADDPSVPVELRAKLNAQIAALMELGFTPLEGWSRMSDPKQRNATILCLLQNAETSDIATAIALKTHGLVEFTRIRSNGSKLETNASPQRNCFPSNPGDDVLRITGSYDPDFVWAVHLARLTSDPLVTVNPPVADAFAYQCECERKAKELRLKTIYWTETRDRAKQRPTMIGAFLMCFRLLPPFAQRFDVVHVRKLKAILLEHCIPQPAFPNAPGSRPDAPPPVSGEKSGTDPGKTGQ